MQIFFDFYSKVLMDNGLNSLNKNLLNNPKTFRLHN